jgi:hypothetical protein
MQAPGQWFHHRYCITVLYLFRARRRLRDAARDLKMPRWDGCRRCRHAGAIDNEVSGIRSEAVDGPAGARVIKAQGGPRLNCKSMTKDVDRGVYPKRLTRARRPIRPTPFEDVMDAGRVASDSCGLYWGGVTAGSWTLLGKPRGLCWEGGFEIPYGIMSLTRIAPRTLLVTVQV